MCFRLKYALLTVIEQLFCGKNNIHQWILVFNTCHKWFQTAVIWPLRKGVYPHGPEQRCCRQWWRKYLYTIHAMTKRYNMQPFLHSLSPLKENQCHFVSSYVKSPINVRKDLLVRVDLVNRRIKFIPAAVRIIIISLINQCCYECVCVCGLR